MANSPKGKDKRLGEVVQDDPEQYRRFVEAARELGCEENFERFEEALPRILRAPPSPAKTKDKPQVEHRKKGRSAD